MGLMLSHVYRHQHSPSGNIVVHSPSGAVKLPPDETQLHHLVSLDDSSHSQMNVSAASAPPIAKQDDFIVSLGAIPRPTVEQHMASVLQLCESMVMTTTRGERGCIGAWDALEHLLQSIASEAYRLGLEHATRAIRELSTESHAVRPAWLLALETPGNESFCTHAAAPTSSADIGRTISE